MKNDLEGPLLDWHNENGSDDLLIVLWNELLWATGTKATYTARTIKLLLWAHYYSYSSTAGATLKPYRNEV